MSGFDQPIPALPLLFEARPDGVDFCAVHVAVGALGEAGGFGFGELEEVAVAG